ncbi:MAG: hypothetical protein OXQ29_15540, partial [Rhodospirillaceae bacterium]|nr:hypothetical protein [Rhodospirillaceae bacterium]
PILATLLGHLLEFCVDSMRYKHFVSSKNRDLIEKCSQENRDLIKQYTRENRDLIEQYSQETIGSLGEVRERLTRIEVRIFPPPSHDDEAEAA